MLVTAHPGGQIYFWRQRAVVNILTVHDGPLAAPSALGNPVELLRARCGVRCIKVWRHAPKACPARTRAGTTHAGEGDMDGARWLMATGSADSAVRIWDVGDKLPSATLTRTRRRTAPEPLAVPVLWLPRAADGSAQAVRALDVTPDGQRLVIGTRENAIYLCELQLQAQLEVGRVKVEVWGLRVGGRALVEGELMR